MESFGKYQVTGLIGEGGFGQVYSGWDPVLKRPVAIKTVSLGLSMARERFMREAEVAAGLRHPCIVTIYDFGEQNGVPYLVQEFLDGEDLSHKIMRHDAGDIAKRIRWLIDVAEGLAVAHGQGIVHRDIKPSNVRVLSDGTIRIMDFGIAKLLEGGPQLTVTNMSMGTSGYVSPEQLEGREIDHRADIFSFGAMAFELMTYRKPFVGDTVQATLYAILTVEPPPINSIEPGCPPSLTACIERCLAKQRDKRYPDLSETIADLQAALVEASTTVRPAESPSVAPAEPVPATVDGRPTDGPPDEAIHPVDRGLRNRKVVMGLAAVALLIIVGWAGASLVTGLLDRGNATALSESPGLDESPAGAAEGVAAVDSGGEPVPAETDLRLNDTNEQTLANQSETETRAGTAASESIAAGPGTSPSERAVVPPAAGGADSSAVGAETVATGGGARADVAAGDQMPAGFDVRRVLVLVNGDRPDAVQTAQTVVLRELLAGGRPVVDPDALDQLRLDNAAVAALTSGGSPAAAIGREYGAGTVVVADLTTDAASAVAGFITGSAIINARMYDSASGELLIVERYQIGAGGTPGRAAGNEIAAIAQASEAVARQMVRAILQRTGG